MKTLLKMTIILCVCTLNTTLASTAMMPQKLSDHRSQPPTPKTSPLLFVLNAKKGYLRFAGDNHYLLRIRLKNLTQIIAFTERPQRLVKTISGKTLLSLWSEGSNSFAKNPPNAVLTANGKPSVAITLTGYRIHANDAQFEFRSLQTHRELMINRFIHHISLTIDDFTGSPVLHHVHQTPCVNTNTRYSGQAKASDVHCLNEKWRKLGSIHPATTNPLS